MFYLLRLNFYRFIYYFLGVNVSVFKESERVSEWGDLVYERKGTQISSIIFNFK